MLQLPTEPVTALTGQPVLPRGDGGGFFLVLQLIRGVVH